MQKWSHPDVRARSVKTTQMGCKIRLFCGCLPWMLLLLAEPAFSITRDQVLVPENTLTAVDVGQVDGELLNLRTLSLSWETTDLVIPGNGGLELRVARSFAKGAIGTTLANWELEIPRIQIQAAPNGKLQGSLNGSGVCNDPRPEDVTPLQTFPPAPQEWVSGSWYWGPMLLLIPGERPKQLVVKLASATQYPADVKYVTTDNWIVRCTNAGSKFRVTSPRGTTFELDKLIDFSPGDYFSGAYGGRHVYGASLVTDVHGNTLTYAYAPHPTVPSRVGPLQSTSGSDGRVVTFQYYATSSAPSSGRLQSFTYEGRSWTFEYDRVTTPGNHVYLKRVTLPLGLTWQYENNAPSPKSLQFWPGLSKVTLPSGAAITYQYQNPIANRGYFIYKRTVTGTDIPTAEFTFTKTQTDDFETVTTVTPVRTEVATFHRGWYDYRDAFVVQPPRNPLFPGVLQTRIIKAAAGTVLRTFQFEYADLPAIGDTGDIVFAGYNQKRPVPVRVQTITERSPGLTYTTTNSSFNAYGLAQTVIEQGNATRQTNRTYFANISSQYVVALPKSEEVVGEGTMNREFFPNGMLQQLNRYGIVETYDYHPSGDLAHRYWTRDGVAHSVAYLSYLRGVPRLEQHPLGVQLERGVNTDGTIQWAKDPLGYITSYEYDALKRPTKIAPPINTLTSIAWPTATQMVLTRGNYEKTVTTDVLWRPVQVKERDLQRPAAEAIYVRSTYDALGRLSFKSIPSHSSTESKGLSHVYDELDRPTQLTDTADGRFITTCYTCLTVSPTDGRHANAERIDHERLQSTDQRFVTFNYYRSFGDPRTRELMQFRRNYDVPYSHFPAGQFIDTTLTRDLLGNLLTVEQGSALRQYVYYPTKLLWKVIDPETGVAEFTYDEVGNRKTSRVGGSAVTSYTYDGLNRLRTTDYPGTTPDINQDYFADGALRYIENSSGRWDYTYDEQRLLRSETLTTNSRTFTFNYEYNGNDALQRITYPSGTVVDSNPDAFGRPTTVGGYAYSIGYHPNGQLKSLTYGNGEVLNMSLDGRNYPDTLTVAKNGVARVNLGFDFDLRGNLSTISDYLLAANSRQLRYDGAGRLTGADGSWGTGSFVYDTRDNINSMTLGSTGRSYQYDAATNRLAGASGAITYSLQYDAYGNVTSNGQYSFVFNDASQLVSVPTVSGLTYRYDGHGKRIRTSVPGGDTYYVYGQAGRLMYQTDTAADSSTEFFYAADRLVAKRDFGAGVNPDLDGDGLPNHIELQLDLPLNNPADAAGDADGDGSSNVAEYNAGTELTNGDTDADGMSDGFEIRFALNAFVNDAGLDADADGLTNLQEQARRTNPNKVDTDNDGVPDGQDPQPTLNPAIIPILQYILSE